MYSSTALILNALFTATLFHPLVTAQQLVGSILHAGEEGDGLVVVTVENNSTSNFSVEARNNLFDTEYPWQPLNITNMAGTAVSLIGAQYAYGQLNDAAFVSMPAGAVWQRELNITSYLPPDDTITKPTSRCYTVQFPDGFWAIKTDDMPAAESLATEFLSPGASRLVDLYIESNVLHLNVTSAPASPATLVVTTQAVPQQAAATEVLGTQTIGIAAIQTYGTSIDQYANNILGG